jgi:hypothetical protein
MLAISAMTALALAGRPPAGDETEESVSDGRLYGFKLLGYCGLQYEDEQSFFPTYRGAPQKNKPFYSLLPVSIVVFCLSFFFLSVVLG